MDAAKIFTEAVRQMRANPVGGRLTYVIHAGLIASGARWWEVRPYHGPNPHRTHIHLSIKAWERDNLRRWTIL